MHFGHFESFGHILRHFSDIEREAELLLITLGFWNPQGSPPPHTTPQHRTPVPSRVRCISSSEQNNGLKFGFLGVVNLEKRYCPRKTELKINKFVGKQRLAFV